MHRFSSSWVLLVVLPGLTGCAIKQYHLHDQAAAQSSQQALDAWKKVQAEPAIKTILENNEKIEKSRAELREALARSVLNLTIQNVAAGRWTLPAGVNTCEQALQQRVGTVLYCEDRRALEDAVRKYLDSHTMSSASTAALKQAQANLQTAKTELSKAEAAMQQEQNLEQANQKRLDALKGGIGASLQAAKSGLESVAGNLQTALDPLAAGEDEVLDAIGKSSQDANLKAAAQNVAAARGAGAAQLKAARDALDKLLSANQEDSLKDARTEWNWVHKAAPAGILRKEVDTLKQVGQTGKDLLQKVNDIDFLVRRLDPNSQPGLNLVLLGYAVDIARAAKDRLDEEVRYLKTQIANAELAQRFARQRMLDARDVAWMIDGNLQATRAFVRDVVKRWLGGGAAEEQIETAMAILPLRWPETTQPPVPADQTILSSLETLGQTVGAERRGGWSRPTPAEKRLANLVSTLVTFVAVKGYEDLYQRDTEQAISAAAYAHQRRLDAINARERESLIGRGLQALAAYHQGGITESDIARIAQAGEVLWIAIQGR